MALKLTPKQQRILVLIRDCQLARGYSPTLQELADELGVSKVTVFEHVEALIRKGALLRDTHKARSLELAPDARMFDEERNTKLPLIGAIAAGKPIEAVENREHLDLEALFTPGKSKRTGDIFVLKVRGDSMIEEQIRDGDYVICKRTENARNGQTVVALIDEHEATLKKFYKDRGRIKLVAANPAYEPMFVDECKIQGVVIGVVRTY
jgi:repressor LexA